MITVYTDGAYSPSRDQGGCAFVVLKDGKQLFTFKKMFKKTTNQRMEMLAACIALESINVPEIEIYSDSAYLVCTMNSGWAKKANLDLWDRLEKAVAKHTKVIFTWVKGHASNPFNSLADSLAVEASEQIDVLTK